MARRFSKNNAHVIFIDNDDSYIRDVLAKFEEVNEYNINIYSRSREFFEDFIATERSKKEIYIIFLSTSLEYDEENNPVEVLDVPPGREVVLLPNKVNINLRGGSDLLGKLKPEQFRAYLKYYTLVQDTTGSVVPEIVLPKNISLQFTKPDRLRYVIRSF